MLNKEELREMSEIRPNDEHYVSLYLNVNPLTNPSGEYVIAYKNMLKERLEALDKSVSKAITRGLAAIDSYVLGNKRQFKKGLAIISSGNGDFFRVYNFNLPIKSELIIDKTPYIKPLLEIFDNYERYLAILVEKDSARIFLIQFGEIVEYGKIESPDVPGRHKKGGWFALSQNHYDRHVDFHVTLHIKDILEHLEGFLKGQEIKNLLIGGPDEAVSMLRKSLPRHLVQKVVGTFRAGMYESTDEILSKVEPIIQGVRAAKDKEIVSELITRAEKAKGAVLGVSDVSEAIQGSKVMRLILLKDIELEGFFCSSCRSLSAQDIPKCPYCGGKMEHSKHFSDFLSQKVEQGAKVEVVSDSKELAQMGGIGAILRF